MCTYYTYLVGMLNLVMVWWHVIIDQGNYYRGVLTLYFGSFSLPLFGKHRFRTVIKVNTSQTGHYFDANNGILVK